MPPSYRLAGREEDIMADSQLGWSEAQWEKVNNAVTEAFAKASVAGAFLPCYGPLADSAEYVRDEKFAETGATVKIEDDATLKLFNLTVKVELSSEQVAEDALSAALLAFRRASNTLAQAEDDLVFNGFEPDNARDLRAAAEKQVTQAKRAREAAVNSLTSAESEYSKVKTDPLLEALKKALKEAHDFETKLQAAEWTYRQLENAKKTNKELTRLIVRAHPDGLDGLAEANHASITPVAQLRKKGKDVGEILVSAVVLAIAKLEDASHPGPFACVLGNDVFEEAHRPRRDSMVLPADRITPLLNGPLLRSGQMDKDNGIVVSLTGSDIDIVVATPPKVQFLQVGPNAKYLFRVYEKFVLRIKDKTAVRPLDLT